MLCVGAGGLGSPALTYLAAAGVGTLGIVDFDVVDESNLQRQVIHGQSDIGRPKATSAAESIREINPFVDVVTHQTALTSENALQIFEGYDLVVDGTDNFSTRYLINDAAVLSHKPCVWGSVFRFDGQAAVFWADHGPCYRCLYPEPPPAGTVPSCAEGGVLGATCATVGSIQVAEAIKLITGVGEPLIGSLVVFDALEMSFRKITVRKDPTCAICGVTPKLTGLVETAYTCEAPTPSIPEDSTITAVELRDWLARGEPMYLVDVREPSEFEVSRISGATLVPKGAILDRSALDALPRDRRLVLYCRSGVRSAAALASLKAEGFSDAVHVDGGIMAWARDVDPSLPTA